MVWTSGNLVIISHCLQPLLSNEILILKNFVTEDCILGFNLQAIPRTVWLDKSGKQLIQWPVAELEMLRDNEIHLQHKSLDAGSTYEITGITAAQVTTLCI